MTSPVTATARREVYDRIERRLPEFVDDLSALARVPTISAERGTMKA